MVRLVIAAGALIKKSLENIIREVNRKKHRKIMVSCVMSNVVDLRGRETRPEAIPAKGVVYVHDDDFHAFADLTKDKVFSAVRLPGNEWEWKGRGDDNPTRTGEPITIQQRERVIAGLQELAPYLEPVTDRHGQPCVQLSYEIGGNGKNKEIIGAVFSACHTMGLNSWDGRSHTYCARTTYQSERPLEAVMHRAKEVLDISGFSFANDKGGSGRYMLFTSQRDLAILASVGVDFTGSENFRVKEI